ncbi:sulfite exporter TauE/SafE family protein [Seongchinamella unica]|uniref:Probable membrane transporter protein n=1 Tax=Seongchinamella unica TaxID=2547392 RepID=A0A4R5LNV1_9GAMM|nr:sulfite exporter TauE/SafE family protein [Seongchinamella unica]TDG12042.1 sulfite exporter TauE/SafE family protein [Seongchinamella unica]
MTATGQAQPCYDLTIISAEFALVPIAFFTSALAGVMGMGGGVLLIAAMPGLVPVQAIFPLHAATQLASNLSRAGFGWQHIQWDILPAIALGALLGALLGGEIYASLDLQWLPLVIGLLILLLTWLPLPQVRGGGQLALLGLGFYQTSLGMLAGATGPLGAAVLLRRNAQRDWLVVNTAMYMSLSHVMRLAAFVVLGFSFGPWWPLLLSMIAAVTAGSWAGTRLRRRVPEMDFQRWFKWLVTLLAMRMIVLPFYGS